MPQYFVEYEVRNIGACGIFWKLADTIEGEDPQAARRNFIDKYTDKYEMRFPISTTEVLPCGEN